MTPIPKTKISALIELDSKILEAQRRGEPLMEFELARATKEANSLLKLPEFRGAAAGLLARLAAVRMDLEGFVTWVRYAEGSVPNDINFAKFVIDPAAWIGDFATAKMFVQRAKSGVLDIPASDYMNVLIRMGCFIEAAELIESNPPASPEHLYQIRAFVKVAELMKKEGVSDDELSARVEVASRVAALRSRRPLQIFSLVADEDGAIYRLPSYGGVEESVDMEWAMVDAINEKFDDSLSRLISFAASPGAGENRPESSLTELVNG